MNQYNKDGQKHGPWKGNHYIFNYYNNVLHGEYRIFHNNGDTYIIGQFNMGELTGFVETHPLLHTGPKRYEYHII